MNMGQSFPRLIWRAACRYGETTGQKEDMVGISLDRLSVEQTFFKDRGGAEAGIAVCVGLVNGEGIHDEIRCAAWEERKGEEIIEQAAQVQGAA